MSETWKNQAFEGGGLQSINVLYNAQSRKHVTAYLLTTIFPIGAHQFYLKNTKLGLLYLSLSLIGLIGGVLFSPIIFGIFLVSITLLVFDIIKMEERINQYNKALKMSLSLQHENQPPQDFQGRYTDENPIDDYMAVKNNEKPSSKKVLSFAEQERLLKEFQKQKNDKGTD